MTSKQSTSKKNFIQKVTFIFLLAILLIGLSVLSALVNVNKAVADSENNINGVEWYPNPKADENAVSIYELLDKQTTCATVQGTTDAEFALQIFGDNSNVQFFMNFADIILGVENEKVDTLCASIATATSALVDYPDIKPIKEMFKSSELGIAFSKVNFNQALCNDLNKFIADSKENGYIEFLKNKWEMIPDISNIKKETRDLSQTTKDIEIAICSQTTPYTAMIQGEISGMEVEMLEKFCEEYGYRPHFTDYNFDGMILAISSGKADIAASSLSITDERKQTMNFSDPYNVELMGIFYKDKSVNANKGFIEHLQDFVASIQSGFYKTFIAESRWLQLLYGLCITLIITITSIIVGGILGIAIAILRTRNIKWLNKLFNGYISIFQGTPLLVLLLIIYYVIFGKADVNGVVVAIIAFSLNNSAYVSEAVKSGLESVDSGQMEAALSLGYTHRKAFKDFIFPQAAKNFLPTCRGLAISLLKDTSIVGYIAITDLTKIGDIIRSRTFDAFFPLITVAIVYFILAYLIRKIFEAANKKLF